jgi:hypothetical protein
MTYNLRSLDKLYNLNPLPAELSENKTALYSHYYLAGGLHALATGQTGTGRQALKHALCLSPALIEGEMPRFVECVAAFADSLPTCRPHAFINLVFEWVPNVLNRHRNRAQAAYHMGRVFCADAAGRAIHITDWLLGNWYAPRWLKNRGVWSILIRHLPRMLRAVATRAVHSRGFPQLSVHA